MDFLDEIGSYILFQFPIYGIIMLLFPCFEDSFFKNTYSLKKGVYGIIAWIIIFLAALWKAPRPQCWIGLDAVGICLEIAKSAIPFSMAFIVSFLISFWSMDADIKAKRAELCKYKKELEELVDSLSALLNHRKTYDLNNVLTKINNFREKSNGYMNRDLDILYREITEKDRENIDWDIIEGVLYGLSHF